LHRARPDVTIYINGVRVILEGSYSKSDAENDVSKRIETGVGDIGIALFYKEAFPQSLTVLELEEKLKTLLRTRESLVGLSKLKVELAQRVHAYGYVRQAKICTHSSSYVLPQTKAPRGGGVARMPARAQDHPPC
jgi:hypothetical protein